MIDYALPPEYVSVPIELVYGDLPRAIAFTGIRIWGLGWRHHYRRTDPIGFKDLCRLCRLSRSQMYAHIDHLRDRGVLRYTDVDGDGKLTFYFEQTGESGTRLSPENRTDVDMIDVVVGSSEMEHISIPIKRYVTHMRAKQQQQGGGMGGDAQSGKPDSARLDVLGKMGVLEPVLSELAGLEWATPEYLLAWARWLEAQQGKVGVGLVVEQVRRGAQAPVTSKVKDPQSAERRRGYRRWGS